MEASCIFPIIFSLITLVIVLVEKKLNLIVKINYKFYLLLYIFKLMFFFFYMCVFLLRLINFL